MKRYAALLLLVLFLVPAPVPGLAADSDNGILLLNSNRSVEKYRVVQEAYQKSTSVPITAYSLEGFQKDISDLYREIERKPYRLIYCIGTKAYLTALKHAPNRDIVFSSIFNWRRLPQGETVYGIANELHPAMHLTHFKQMFPQIRRIGILYAKAFNEQWIEVADEAAKGTGITIQKKAVVDIDETTQRLQALIPVMDALWLIPDPMIISSRKNLAQIIQACDTAKIPVFSYNQAFAEFGATLIVSVDDSTVGRQAAMLSEDLISGKAPASRIQLPAGSTILLNLDKVKAFGLSYNPAALEMINQVIDSTSMKP